MGIVKEIGSDDGELREGVVGEVVIERIETDDVGKA